MKFTLSTILLAASLSGFAAAQSSSSTTAESSSVSSTSSSSSSTAASSGSQSSSSNEDSRATPTCTLVSGDPKAPKFGCPANAVTSTPPYDSASLQSYLIGEYTPGKEGTAFSEVASQLADSVTDLYPTLTVSYSAIVEQYVTALSASAKTYDAAPSSFHVPHGLGAAAAVGVAAILGGAFIL